ATYGSASMWWLACGRRQGHPVNRRDPAPAAPGTAHHARSPPSSAAYRPRSGNYTREVQRRGWQNQIGVYAMDKRDDLMELQARVRLLEARVQALRTSRRVLMNLLTA